MPLPVSILIPCHNAEQHLEQCLNSAIIQDVAEIILLNDASTDNSWAIAQQFADYVQLHSQTSQGAQKTRNNLLSWSSQPWVQFLDADDLLYPGKIQTQLEAATDNDDVLFCNFRIQEWNQNEIVSEVDWDTGTLSFLEALVRWERLSQTNAFLFRRIVFNLVEWDESYQYLTTHKLSFDLLKSGANFRHIPYMGAIYRRGWSGGQLTDKANEMARMAVREQFSNELFAWVKANYGTQYDQAIALTKKRLDYEKSKLGM